MSNISLYELTGELLTLMNNLYNADIEEEELIEEANRIEMAIEDKADGYAKIIKMIDANINSIDDELKRLTTNKKTLANRKSLLIHNLEGSMRVIGKTKFKTDLFSFGIQNNPPKVVIENEAAFLEQCMRDGRDEFVKYKDPELNKTAVKNAILKDGEYIEGAEIVQESSLRIR